MISLKAATSKSRASKSFNFQTRSTNLSDAVWDRIAEEAMNRKDEDVKPWSGQKQEERGGPTFSGQKREERGGSARMKQSVAEPVVPPMSVNPGVWQTEPNPHAFAYDFPSLPKASAPSKTTWTVRNGTTSKSGPIDELFDEMDLQTKGKGGKKKGKVVLKWG